MYEHAYTNGMIEDSEMDKLNIPMDSDCHGRIIHRDGALFMAQLVTRFSRG